MKRTKQKTNHLIRMVALLAMLLVGVNVSWGSDTYTTKVELSFLNSSFEANGTKQYSSAEGLTNAKISWSNIANETMEVGGNKYYKFNGDDAYIQIWPYYPGVPAVFMPGDVVKVHMVASVDETDAGFCIKTSRNAAGGWQKISANTDYEKTYTLKAEDINDDGSITIYRLGYASNLKYYSFEVESKRYTVTFSDLYGGGNVTATANGNSISSGEKVAAGTDVTFTAVPTGDNLAWKWVIDGTEKYSQDPQTITITKDITVQHQFGSVYVNVYTNNAELGTVNVAHKGVNATTFHVTPYSGDFTLTATPTANGIFKGWYKDADHTQKIDGAEATYSINNPEGTNNYFALFEAGAITHPVVTCQNNIIDLSKITVVSGATYNPSTHAGSITANYGTISIKFSEPVDLHELDKLTLAGTNVEKTDAAGAFNGASFKYEGGGEFLTYNYPFSITNPTDEQKESLKKVTEITLFGDNANHKGDFTLTSITLNFGGSHTKKSTPVLNGGTTAEMVIAAGCPFTLSATNGYWREYKSDFSGEKAGGLISGVWNPQHDFTEGISTVGHYYFGIQDNDNKSCVFEVNHHSDLTRVHVEVIAATPNITSCENAHIDLANIRAYGNTTFNGSTGEFVVNNYNQYGNGLQIAFAGPQNFSNAKTITINGAEFKNPNMREVESSDIRWPQVVAQDDKTVINLNNKNNANYDAVTFFELRDIQAGTYTISSIDVEFDHTPAAPQLVNGTTATMVLPVGKTLKLSANNVDDTYWREYDAINGNLKNDRISSDENNAVREISGLTQGTYYFAAERRKTCEFDQAHSATEKTWVTVEVEPVGTIPNELDRIKQPIYGQNHSGMAKEYIAIANLTASNGESVTGWGVTSATGTAYKNTTDDKSSTDESTKQKIAYVLGGHEYKVNAENGLCISQWGRAGLIEGQAALPTRATLMLKAAGTMDFFILANNLANGGDGSNESRRHIKVWYTNDQNVDASGNRILMSFKCANENTNNDFWFYGERKEDRSNGLSPLQVGVRLQHLGSDGTCEIYITYEDDVKDENVWIKGILVKRPDLTVTIGRTDKLYYNGDTPNHSNTKLTPFGENQPYQWDFGTAGFYAKIPGTTGATATNEKKKVNEHDGRTYICGEHNGVQLMDHLLVYSDGAGDKKANFDGRRLTNGHDIFFPDDESDCNEHIEFLHPTTYSGKNTYNEQQNGFDANRRSFYPILSNGLKVNVTGSGWFTIACAAPNGPVKMRVLSSTNGGSTYMNILREFIVSNEEDNTSADGYNKDTYWHTYRVYLKAHHEHGYKDGNNQYTDQSQGFWDGTAYPQTYKDASDNVIELDPEESQMSLYVVFDKLETYKGQTVEYKDNGSSADAQLNIHYMQWINEMPADYVFQREEDPKLLNSRQYIVSNGNKANPGLYWQAGTSMTEDKYSSTSKTENNENYPSAYNSAGQDATEGGQSSGWDKISTDLGCTWNVAAKAHTIAHTEENYANHGKTYQNFTLAYDADKAKDSRSDYSDKNLEFAIPVSGSFLRFMPMKNQFISAWVVPEEGKTTNIYVLDETGKPIPFCPGADMQDGNKSKVTQAAREHGWIHAASGAITDSYGNVIINSDNSFSADGTTSLRIDFAALASKEYFIVSNNGTISLARLQATNNAYRAGVEEISEAVTLKDGGTDNAAKISTAMSGTGRYASEGKAITLQRTFAAGKWASLVLPFSLNEKKFEEIFGVGAKCLNFTRVDKETNTIVFTHHFYNMVVAGRPVFVYPTKNVTNPEFTDVTLSAATVTNTSTNNGDFTFKASYDNSTISKGDLFMNNQNGTNYWTGTNNSYPGMRSFIKNNNNWDFSTGINVTQQQTKAVFLNFDEIMDDEISTSIEEYVRGEFGENAVVVTKSTKAYDLNGRVVAAGADINKLPAGIYIVNGKKFIVK